MVTRTASPGPFPSIAPRYIDVMPDTKLGAGRSSGLGLPGGDEALVAFVPGGGTAPQTAPGTGLQVPGVSRPLGAGAGGAGRIGGTFNRGAVLFLLTHGAMEMKANHDADQILRAAGLSRADVNAQIDRRIPADATIARGQQDINERRATKNAVTGVVLDIWDRASSPQEAYRDLRAAVADIGKSVPQRQVGRNQSKLFEVLANGATQTSGPAPRAVTPGPNTPTLPTQPNGSVDTRPTPTPVQTPPSASPSTPPAMTPPLALPKLEAFQSGSVSVNGLPYNIGVSPQGEDRYRVSVDGYAKTPTFSGRPDPQTVRFEVEAPSAKAALDRTAARVRAGTLPNVLSADDIARIKTGEAKAKAEAKLAWASAGDVESRQIGPGQAAAAQSAARAYNAQALAAAKAAGLDGSSTAFKAAVPGPDGFGAAFTGTPAQLASAINKSQAYGNVRPGLTPQDIVRANGLGPVLEMRPGVGILTDKPLPGAKGWSPAPSPAPVHTQPSAFDGNTLGNPGPQRRITLPEQTPDPSRRAPGDDLDKRTHPGDTRENTRPAQPERRPGETPNLRPGDRPPFILTPPGDPAKNAPGPVGDRPEDLRPGLPPAPDADAPAERDEAPEVDTRPGRPTIDLPKGTPITPRHPGAVVDPNATRIPGIDLARPTPPELPVRTPPATRPGEIVANQLPAGWDFGGGVPSDAFDEMVADALAFDPDETTTPPGKVAISPYKRSIDREPTAEDLGDNDYGLVLPGSRADKVPYLIHKGGQTTPLVDGGGPDGQADRTFKARNRELFAIPTKNLLNKTYDRSEDGEGILSDALAEAGIGPDSKLAVFRQLNDTFGSGTTPPRETTYLELDPSYTGAPLPIDVARMKAAWHPDLELPTITSIVGDSAVGALTPNADDKAALARMRGLTAAGRFARSADFAMPARFLNHFLMGSGKSIQLSRKDSNDLAQDVLDATGRNGFAPNAKAAEKLRQAALSATPDANGDVSFTADFVHTAKAARFATSLGSFHVGLSFSGKAYRGEDGTVTLRGKVAFLFNDEYDWTSPDMTGRVALDLMLPRLTNDLLPKSYRENAEGLFDGGVGDLVRNKPGQKLQRSLLELDNVTDSVWARLAEVRGGAVPFRTFGVSRQMDVTIELPANRGLVITEGQ